jgi:hypothetical protein
VEGGGGTTGRNYNNAPGLAVSFHCQWQPNHHLLIWHMPLLTIIMWIIYTLSDNTTTTATDAASVWKRQWNTFSDDDSNAWQNTTINQDYSKYKGGDGGCDDGKVIMVVVVVVL